MYMYTLLTDGYKLRPKTKLNVSIKKIFYLKSDWSFSIKTFFFYYNFLSYPRHGTCMFSLYDFYHIFRDSLQVLVLQVFV